MRVDDNNQKEIIMNTTELAEILQNAMNIKGITKKNIIAAYGHNNVNKAYATINNILGGAVFNETIMEHDMMKTIIKLLEIPEENIREAVKRDWLCAEEEEEAARRSIFTPLIYAETKETRPSSITMFGLASGMKRWKIIELPLAIANIPEEEQLEIIREEIKDHFKRQEGVVPFFGKIIGYRYQKTYDTSYLFTTEGEKINGDQGGFIVPEVYVTLG